MIAREKDDILETLKAPKRRRYKEARKQNHPWERTDNIKDWCSLSPLMMMSCVSAVFTWRIRWKMACWVCWEIGAQQYIWGIFYFSSKTILRPEAIKREANLVSMWQENITLVEEIVVDEPLCKSRRCYWSLLIRFSGHLWTGQYWQIIHKESQYSKGNTKKRHCRYLILWM